MLLIIYTFVALALGFAVCLVAGRDRAWVLQAAYAGTVVACLITAAKLVEAPGGVVVSVAIGLYSMSFLLTDFLSEIHGKAAAFRAVGMGILVQLLTVFAIYFSVAIEPAAFWQEPNEAFREALGTAPRIMAASITAFVVAQSLDVTVFHFIKKKMHDRLLFVRNNLSTFAGQTADTIVFYTIAFIGVPGVNLLELIIVTCLVKYAIAVLDTPFLYAARRLVTGHWSTPLTEG